MIISASRRTDIPAFYADWFMNRVRAGYFYRVNPFNSRQVAAFSLQPAHVDAICFWTRNPRPLLPHLAELDERGLNYYFQFTLNAYDRTFEPHLPPLDERIETMIELAGRIGPERVVWRYDPIILSSVTSAAWHLNHADRLAARLENVTRRLMFSFCDFYGKGEGRLGKSLQGTGIRLADINAPGQRGLLEQVARGLSEIAVSHSLEIVSCSEEVDLAAVGIAHGACIDPHLIRKLFGVDLNVRKDSSQRTNCNCVEAVDMGAYNSCRYGCAYCYANFNAGMIKANCRNHFPDSPALLGRYEEPVEIRTSLSGKTFRPSFCAGRKS